MSPLVKGLLILFGFPVVLTMVFFTYFNVTGEERMRAVCAQIKPEMTLAGLKEFALEKNLRLAGEKDGIAFLSDSLSYGRHTCKLHIVSGVVKAAEYAYAD